MVPNNKFYGVVFSVLMLQYSAPGVAEIGVCVNLVSGELQRFAVRSSQCRGTRYFSLATSDQIPIVERGPAGQIGPQGVAGKDGKQGETGPSGPRGPIGLTGPRGPSGLPGAQGKKGLAGPRGLPGPKGPRGNPGTTGRPGAKGDKGDRGHQGSVGPPGPKGPQGQMGLRGPAGDRGPTGKEGPRGAVGPSGPQGATGRIGSRGPKGNVGIKGDRGPPGPPGVQGEPGSLSHLFSYRVTRERRISGSFATTSALCPRSDLLTGGGCEMKGGGSHQYSITGARPIPNIIGGGNFKCDARCIFGSDCTTSDNLTLIATAVCVAEEQQ